jgi:hypothetical protein
MAGLAYAGADHTPFQLTAQGDRSAKGAVKALGQAGQGLRLHRQDAAADDGGVEGRGLIIARHQGALVGLAGARAGRSWGAWATRSAVVAWPKGFGERRPSPWGQTRAKAMMAITARAIREKKIRSDMTGLP